MRASTKAPDAPHLDVSAAYGPLQTYLTDRYADTVVLTFVDIEALLGFALPALARLEPAWWSNDDEDGAASPHSAAWLDARRTARANLPAQIVVFERVSG